jgi:hypothetical protein
MVSHILARGLGVMALISALTAVATSIGHTGGGHERGSMSTSSVRASADREMATMARNIDRTSVGDTRVASFLASEFGMSEEAMLTEKRTLRASWGNLTIAHTLAAGDGSGMAAAQVLQLHDRGMGWGQVAVGLRLKLEDALRAVKAESRVAMGRAKADGHVAPIGADGF